MQFLKIGTRPRRGVGRCRLSLCAGGCRCPRLLHLEIFTRGTEYNMHESKITLHTMGNTKLQCSIIKLPLEINAYRMYPYGTVLPLHRAFWYM